MATAELAERLITADEGDILTLPTVLPGFELPIARLFE